MAGYPGTPLVKKLGVTAATRVGVFGDPGHVRDLVSPLPERAELVRNPRRPCGLYLIFTPDRRRLSDRLQRVLPFLPPEGAVWVCWPKRSSGVATDVTEDVVREEALQRGLVDVKVCAVDDLWSGLKLVVPVAQRSEWPGPRLGEKTDGQG